MQFDPISLQLFIAVAETGSISAAADKRGLALGASSRRILRLEADAGTPLLERGARGVTLTSAGTALLRHARDIVEAIDRLAGDMAEYGAGQRGSVRVFANTSCVIQFLPEDLRRFMEAYPSLRVDLEERPSEDVVRAVRDGTAEVGLFDVRGAEVATGIQSRPYRRDRLVALVPGDHRLARRKRVAFEELLDDEFITFRPGTALRTLVTTQAQHAGRNLKVRIQVKGFDALARMVHARVGVGVVPAGTAGPYERDLRVRAIALEDAWAERLHCVGCRDFDALPRGARALVDFLVPAPA